LQDTVLLVDDNPVQVATRQLVLSQAGIPVQVATSASSALALLRTPAFGTQIKTVVTDHIMPETSGAEFVRMLRKVNPEVPVIVVTGLAEAEEEYEGLNVTFRQKPCPPTELIALVKQALSTN
jgi:CheY-like chemotaxis protein